MSQELIQSLEKLSEQNPNPIFSVNREGLVLQTNPACAKVLEDWKLGKGDPAPVVLTSLIDSAFKSTRPQKQSLSCTNGLYDFEVIPILELDFNFALVHGYAPNSSQEKRLKAIKHFDTFLFSEKKNKLLIQNALDGIITIDGKGVIQSFNPAAEKIFGYSAGEVIGKNISQLMPEPDKSQHDGYLEKYFKTGKANIIGMSREVQGLKKDGSSFFLELNVNEMIWEGKSEFVGIVRDITQRKLMEEKLLKLSVLDGLTEIGNRRLFDETLNSEWKRAMRDQHSLSLIMLDIDFFKLYNDSYGHQGGDTCLKQVATALDQCVQRPADLVARYGGEEFAVVLPETTLVGACNLAEAIRSSIEDLKIEHNKSVVGSYVTVSAGVSALTPKRGALCEQLISNADKALYQAKENGRNQVSAEEEAA
jgi:diguanylate cyclase (GGDEF)-like protein/PAS domain S-box-containing protein